MNFNRVVIMAIAVLGVSTRSAFPANGAWDHGGTDDLWSNPLNWTNNVVPSSNDLVTLGNSASNGPQTVLLDTNVWLNRLTCSATGNRDYTINSINGATITFLSGHDLYCVGRTAKLTINCDIWATTDLQVDRVGGLTTLNGNCGGGQLAAQDPGELVLGGSNSFTLVRADGGEIVVNNRNALGLGYFKFENTNGILSLATNTDIKGALYATYPFVLRLKDSETNDVTLTVGGQCFNDRITIGTNAGTSTGSLTIRLLVYSSHNAEWTLSELTTLVFANPSNTATWGDTATPTNNGSITGPGRVRIESGGEVLINCTNDYTGGTVLQSGTLRLGGNDRLPVPGDFTILPGGKFYMNSYTQTVAKFNGAGIVQFAYSSGNPDGILTVSDTFKPGDSVGTLVCTNNGRLVLGPACTSIFELDSLAGVSDKVALTNTTSDLTLDGTLKIENLGGLQSGNYTLFDLNNGALAGSFTNLVMPKNFLGTIVTNTGDVVLHVGKITLPGVLTIVR